MSKEIELNWGKVKRAYPCLERKLNVNRMMSESTDGRR